LKLVICLNCQKIVTNSNQITCFQIKSS